MWKVDRGTELTVRKRRDLVARLDRLTACFASAVIAAFAALFAFHVVRFAMRMVA